MLAVSYDQHRIRWYPRSVTAQTAQVQNLRTIGGPILVCKAQWQLCLVTNQGQWSPGANLCAFVAFIAITANFCFTTNWPLNQPWTDLWDFCKPRWVVGMNGTSGRIIRSPNETYSNKYSDLKFRTCFIKPGFQQVSSQVQTCTSTVYLFRVPEGKMTRWDVYRALRLENHV
jgi:hypothetical protein